MTAGKAAAATEPVALAAVAAAEGWAEAAGAVDVAAAEAEPGS